MKKGISPLVIFIVVAIVAVAVLIAGMYYGIVPLYGELGKWVCWQRLRSACDKWTREGAGALEELSKVWETCRGFFPQYTEATSFCIGEIPVSGAIPSEPSSEPSV